MYNLHKTKEISMEVTQFINNKINNNEFLCNQINFLYIRALKKNCCFLYFYKCVIIKEHFIAKKFVTYPFVTPSILISI